MNVWIGTNKARILICPLNWGLGHATRCIPLIRELIHEGHEVVIAADGHPLFLLRQVFPQLQWIEWSSYRIQYSKSNSQIGAILLSALPILWGIYLEHRVLKRLLRTQRFDVVISDNRFGMYHSSVQSIYITHQLMIKMPQKLKFLEKLFHFIHTQLISKYKICWIPDFSHSDNLSGDLAHKYPLPHNTQFIGPLSRFKTTTFAINTDYEIVALISGPEPQRTMLEEDVISKYRNGTKSVLIVQGLPAHGEKMIKYGNMSIVPHLVDEILAPYLLGAERIICRSGYSSIMDLHTLNCLHKADLIPTPGQTEQEYLAGWHRNKKNVVSL